MYTQWPKRIWWPRDRPPTVMNDLGVISTERKIRTWAHRWTIFSLWNEFIASDEYLGHGDIAGTTQGRQT